MEAKYYSEMRDIAEDVEAGYRGRIARLCHMGSCLAMDKRCPALGQYIGMIERLESDEKYDYLMLCALIERLLKKKRARIVRYGVKHRIIYSI